MGIGSRFVAVLAVAFAVGLQHAEAVTAEVGPAKDGIAEHVGNGHATSLRATFPMVGRTESRDDDDDDDDDADRVQPSCPFVAEEYDIEFQLGNQKVEIKFSPEAYGVDPGYYCSMSTVLGDARYRYSFGNCTCGVLASCYDDWTRFDMNILGGMHSFYVGQCQPKAWIIALSTLLTLAFIGCVCRAVYRATCTRRTEYTISEVYEERLLPTSGASDAQATNRVLVERTTTTRVK